MLIEIKTRTTRNVDGKPRTTSETYLKDGNFLTDGEYAVTALLETATEVVSYDITNLRPSPIKEFLSQRADDDERSYIAILKAVYTDDNGNEKSMRYQTLLWAHSLMEANARAQEHSREGYDMRVESITEKEYIVLP